MSVVNRSTQTITIIIILIGDWLMVKIMSIRNLYHISHMQTLLNNQVEISKNTNRKTSLYYRFSIVTSILGCGCRTSLKAWFDLIWYNCFIFRFTSFSNGFNRKLHKEWIARKLPVTGIIGPFRPWIHFSRALFHRLMDCNLSANNNNNLSLCYVYIRFSWAFSWLYKNPQSLI